jgi:hypothetical protein
MLIGSECRQGTFEKRDAISEHKPANDKRDAGASCHALATHQSA